MVLAKYVISHDHKFNIALKPKSQGVKTVFQNVEWQVSRFGTLIPVAVFEPAYILNREITRASLSNYKNFLRMDLDIGDEIFITLNNDVIPYLEKNITKNIEQ